MAVNIFLIENALREKRDVYFTEMLLAVFTPQSINQGEKKKVAQWFRNLKINFEVEHKIQGRIIKAKVSIALSCLGCPKENAEGADLACRAKVPRISWRYVCFVIVF